MKDISISDRVPDNRKDVIKNKEIGRNRNTENVDRNTEENDARDILAGMAKNIDSFIKRNWTKARPVGTDKVTGAATALERDNDQIVMKMSNRMKKLAIDNILHRLKILSDTPQFENAEKAMLVGDRAKAKGHLEDLQRILKEEPKKRDIATEHGKLTVSELKNDTLSEREINFDDIKSKEAIPLNHDGNIHNGYRYIVKSEDKQKEFAEKVANKAGKPDSTEYHQAFHKALDDYDTFIKTAKDADKKVQASLSQTPGDPNHNGLVDVSEKAWEALASARGEEVEITKLVIAARDADAAEKQAERELRRAPDLDTVSINNQFAAGMDLSVTKNHYAYSCHISNLAWEKLANANDEKLEATKQKYRTEYHIDTINDSAQIEILHHSDGSTYTGIEINIDEIDFAKSGRDRENGNKFTLHFNKGESEKIVIADIDDLSETLRQSAGKLLEKNEKRNATQVEKLLKLLDNNDPKTDENVITLAFANIRLQDRTLSSAKKAIMALPAPKGDEVLLHQVMKITELKTSSFYEIIALIHPNLKGVLEESNNSGTKYSEMMGEQASSMLDKGAAKTTTYREIAKIAQYEHPLRGNDASFALNDYHIHASAGQLLEMPINSSTAGSAPISLRELTEELLRDNTRGPAIRARLMQRSVTKAYFKHDHGTSSRQVAMADALHQYGMDPVLASDIASAIKQEMDSGIDAWLNVSESYSVGRNTITDSRAEYLTHTCPQIKARDIAENVAEAYFKHDYNNPHRAKTMVEAVNQHLNDPKKAHDLVSSLVDKISYSRNTFQTMRVRHPGTATSDTLYNHLQNHAWEPTTYQTTTREIIKNVAEARLKDKKNNAAAAMTDAICQHINYPAGAANLAGQIEHYITGLGGRQANVEHLEKWLKTEPESTYRLEDPLHNLWKNKYELTRFHENILNGVDLGINRPVLQTIDEKNLDNPALNLNDKEKKLARAAIQFQNKWVENLQNAHNNYMTDTASPKMKEELRIVVENSLLQVTQLEQNRSNALDALKNDKKSVIQRKQILNHIVTEVGKPIQTLEESEKELPDRIKKINAKLDSNLRAMYDHQANARDEKVNIGEMVTRVSTAAAELAPLIVEERIRRYLANGEYDEAEKLSFGRSSAEKEFKATFNTYYENEAKRYQDMEKVKLSHQAAMKQLRMFVIMYAIANANQAATNLNDTFNSLSRRAFAISIAK